MLWSRPEVCDPGSPRAVPDRYHGDRNSPQGIGPPSCGGACGLSLRGNPMRSTQG